VERADPIVALATASGRAAIGVIRLSGRNLALLFPVLFGRHIPPRRATRTDFLDAAGAPLDNGVALFFPGPRSYTGEDVLELQGHGGPAVLQLVLRRCIELGARLAEPGEFTRRAFLSGKLDLAQAESVADLIDAGSAAAAKSALRSLRGELSERIGALQAGLVELRTLVEASLDFPEEDLDALSDHKLAERVAWVERELKNTLKRASAGKLLRDGVHIVLVGRPNVGKSSLLNRFAGEEVAIVSDVPGTTRDALREHLVIGGVPVHLVDTAGLRDASDVVEQLGIARTRTVIEKADLALVIFDASRRDPADEQALISGLPSLHRIIVWNKIDLTGESPRVERTENSSAVWISAKLGTGLEGLEAEILRCVGFDVSAEGVFVARERHLDALRRASTHLAAGKQSLDHLEVLAEELRLAHDALGDIVGRVTSDDLLGEIFSRFCIGK
jgi:tRNA modification GTPase